MKNKKIIIVEDEKVLIKILSIELLTAGYQILSSPDGKSGLDLIRKEKPDLGLLDLLMPKMDGFQVLDALKKDEATKEIPVIVFSNDDKSEDQKKVRAMGVVDYLIKPQSKLKDLVKKIKETLG